MDDTRILIADDDRVVAEMFRDIIMEEDRAIDVFYDGKSATNALRSVHYDLIIVDLVMPDVGGIDLLRFAKKLHPDVIAIIITGYASLETAIMAIKEGAYDYITKPSKLEEVRIAVNNAVEKIRLNKMNRDLVAKLQKVHDEYNRIIHTREEKISVGDQARLNFFPPNMPSLHHVMNRTGADGNDVIEKIQALAALKNNGVFTEKEFEMLKKQLLDTKSL